MEAMLWSILVAKSNAKRSRPRLDRHLSFDFSRDGRGAATFLWLFREIAGGEESSKSANDLDVERAVRCHHCNHMSRLKERSPIYLKTTESGEKIYVHSSCQKVTYTRESRRTNLNSRCLKSLRFCSDVMVFNYPTEEEAPPNLSSVLEGGGIEALHKHTGLPFSYQRKPIFTFDP